MSSQTLVNSFEERLIASGLLDALASHEEGHKEYDKKMDLIWEEMQDAKKKLETAKERGETEKAYRLEAVKPDYDKVVAFLKEEVARHKDTDVQPLLDSCMKKHLKERAPEQIQTLKQYIMHEFGLCGCGSCGTASGMTPLEELVERIIGGGN